MKVRKLLEYLNTRNPDESVAAQLWFAEDVSWYAEENDFVIPSHEICEAIIENLDSNMSCDYGVSWDDIEDSLRAFNVPSLY